jgi:hypothetical protein
LLKSAEPSPQSIQRSTLPDSLDQALREWRDFYILGGTAGATLVGLMFVFASIGASQLARRNTGAMRAFITPTVVHFGAVLLICLVSIMPGHGYRSLGVALGVSALIGGAYCGQVLRLISRRFAAGLAWEDRLFYALIPLAGYLLLLASAALELDERPADANVLAGIAIIVLIVAGLRNAWDMTVWMTTRDPNPAPPVAEGG